MPDDDDEDRAATKAALLQAIGSRSVLHVVGDPPVSVSAHAILDLVRAASELAVAVIYDCATADLDLAALQACKLSVEGRARLAQHLGRCERCMAVATAIADSMEAARRGKISDPRRGPAGGVGGSA